MTDPITALVAKWREEAVGYVLGSDRRDMLLEHADELAAVRQAQQGAGDSRPAGEAEICICAAMRLDDGRVIRGHRHDDCIQTALKWREAGQDIGKVRQEAQGFVTSRNRYVDRVEGMRLQVEAGLFKPRVGAQILMSEDFY